MVKDGGDYKQFEIILLRCYLIPRSNWFHTSSPWLTLYLMRTVSSVYDSNLSQEPALWVPGIMRAWRGMDPMYSFISNIQTGWDLMQSTARTDPDLT